LLAFTTPGLGNRPSPSGVHACMRDHRARPRRERRTGERSRLAMGPRRARGRLLPDKPRHRPHRLLGLSTGAEAVVTEAASDKRVEAVVADGLQARTAADASLWVPVTRIPRFCALVVGGWVG
jgi:hypothetical protein